MDRSRVLVSLVRVVLVLILVEAVVSILARWPHQFGGQGDPHRMTQQFISSGTALAPPLFVIIGLLLVALLVGRQDRWGLLAAVAMIAISAIMVIGSVGEAIAPATSDVPRAVQLVGGIVDVTASAALLVVAIWDVLRRVRHAPVQSAH